ncbi:two-component regulator propeller domain-containing protein [Mucilaginibacter sp. P25]|uniref:two-component regulator propeller domain-containing protein n=1 Tax=unclassified Mucilaginibacter TaxID=2617802 RepID=UPI003D6669E5
MVWYGNGRGLHISKKQNTLLRYLSITGNPNSISSNWVRDILLFDAQSLWFATRTGICILNTATQKFTNYKHDPLNPNSLNDNAIWSFMKDRAGCVWVGTFGGGSTSIIKGMRTSKISWNVLVMK